MPMNGIAKWRAFTQKAVADGIAAIPSDRKLELFYTDFCANPAKVYRQIFEKYQSMGCNISSEYTGNECFDESNDVRLSKEEERNLREALSRFEADVYADSGASS